MKNTKIRKSARKNGALPLAPAQKSILVQGLRPYTQNTREISNIHEHTRLFPKTKKRGKTLAFSDVMLLPVPSLPVHVTSGEVTCDVTSDPRHPPEK